MKEEGIPNRGENYMFVLSWNYNRARIWLDEFPDWKLAKAHVFEHRQEASEMKETDARLAAIELFIPTGGRAYYGALGAEFVPASEKQLVVQVLISLEEGQMIPDALASRNDTVHVGLPQEYLQGVLHGILNTSEIHLLGSGTLRFCRAASGSLGSSIKLFGILTALVIQLLLLDKDAVSEEQLIKLIQTELSKQGMRNFGEKGR